MIRNFVAGLVWGTVVAGLGLGVISQVAPMPMRHDGGQAAPKVSTAETAPVEAMDPASVPESVETVTVAPQPAEPATPAPAADPAPAAPQDAAKAPPAVAEAPAAPTGAEPGQSNPNLAADQTTPAPASPSAQPEAQGSDPAPASADLPPPPQPEAEEALLTPAPAPAAPPEPALVTPEPVTPEATPTPHAAAEPALEIAQTAPEVSAAPETLSPDGALPKAVEGVTTDRLPAIGKTDPVAPPAAEAKAPIDRFARAFDNPAGKPMFAVVLIDNGSADLDRARLAALPFPVTFAIDPANPNAAQAAQIYRAAGQEVVMLATGIPANASAADLEQSFQANAAALPESVAVLDLAEGGFSDNRPLATMVVPVLKSQGRGLLTYDQGLNAADQVARREGLRAATIFRSLDAESEDTPLIRRFLDRAAFRAAQEGRVVVIGQTRDETVAALLEWTVEGRAATLALAPLSAVLITPN